MWTEVSTEWNDETKFHLLTLISETALHELVSDEALGNLKLYKYSSVDKSYISHYILRHYVRDPDTSS